MKNHNEVTNNNEVKAVEDLIDAGDVVMVSTRDAEGAIGSRPLTVAEVAGSTLRFLVDRSAPWAQTVRVGAPVNAALVDGGHNLWASLTADGLLVDDRVLVQRLWSKPAEAYFAGADDPSITVLELHVRDGEYWSAPGGGPVGRLLSLVGTALGKGDALNDHGPVRG